MSGHDHLRFPCSASRLEQLGDELKSSRVNAVIGFLRSDERRAVPWRPAASLSSQVSRR